MPLPLLVEVMIVIQSVVAWILLTSTMAQNGKDFGLMDHEVCSSAFGICSWRLGEH